MNYEIALFGIMTSEVEDDSSRDADHSDNAMPTQVLLSHVAAQ